MDKALYILAVYFSIGFIANLVIAGKRDKQQQRQLWIKYFTYLFIVAIIIGTSLYYPDAVILIGFIILTGAGAELLYQGFVVRHTIIPFLLLLPVAWLFMNLCMVARVPQFAFVYMIVLCFDGFSQLSGQLFGEKKLMPKISPAKTVSGLTGGALMAILTSTILQDISLTNVFTTLWIILFAFSGDTLASWLKRKWKIKDYSYAIPGHGGFLDRFDSFIMAGAAYILLQYFR